MKKHVLFTLACPKMKYSGYSSLNGGMVEAGPLDNRFHHLHASPQLVPPIPGPTCPLWPNHQTLPDSCSCLGGPPDHGIPSSTWGCQAVATAQVVLRMLPSLATAIRQEKGIKGIQIDNKVKLIICR